MGTTQGSAVSVEPGEPGREPSDAGRYRVLHRRAVRLEWFTIGWNVVEAVVAIGAGIIASSVALIGFGADSGIEVMSAVFVAWRLRAARPGDHPDRHRAAEVRALFGIAVTFFLLAAYIGFEAARALIGGEAPERSTVGLVLSVLSLAIMPVLAVMKSRTGREMGSRALRADAVETWVCAWLSFALLLGVGLFAAFGWGWADPVAALLMLPVVVWQGFEALEAARGGGG
jgi:cation diffusion facilitator family transporter